MTEPWVCDRVRKDPEKGCQLVEAEKVVCQARSIWTGPLTRTGAHRAQTASLRGNVTCAIEARRLPGVQKL